jgi:hypothetical protein
MEAIIEDPIFLRKLLGFLALFAGNSSRGCCDELLLRICPESRQLQLTLCYQSGPLSQDADNLDLTRARSQRGRPKVSENEQYLYSRSSALDHMLLQMWCNCPISTTSLTGGERCTVLGMRVLSEWRDQSICFSAPLRLFDKSIQAMATYSGSSIKLSCATGPDPPSNTHKQSVAATVLLSSEQHSMGAASKFLTLSINSRWIASVDDQDDLFYEPTIPCPQIYLSFSSLVRLKSVLQGILSVSKHSDETKSKLRSDRKHVLLRATASWGNDPEAQLPEQCSLELSPCLTETDSSFRAIFTLHAGQEMHFVPAPNSSQANSMEMPKASISSIVNISAHDFHRILHCEALAPASVVLGISDKVALVVYIHWPPTTLTFVLPSRPFSD